MSVFPYRWVTTVFLLRWLTVTQKIKLRAKCYPFGTLHGNAWDFLMLLIEGPSEKVSEWSIGHTAREIVGEVANCQTPQQRGPSWWVQPLAFLTGLGGKWVMEFELAKTRIFTLKGIFYPWAKANWNTPSLGLFIQTRTMRSIFNRKWGKGREMAAEVIGYKGQSLKLSIILK